MNDTFKPAAWGGVAIAWSIAYVGVFLYFVQRIVARATSSSSLDVFDLAAGLLLFGFIVFAWARSVKGYRLADSTLIIERRIIKDVSVPLDKLTSVQVDPDISSFFNMSVLGSGGLFGWGGRSGVRKKTEIAPLIAYVYGTNPKNSVLLKADGDKNIVVTPIDPQGFVDALNKADNRPRFSASRVTATVASKKKRR